MSTFDYDLFVIGGGSGGVRAARVAAGETGAKVGLAEESRYGGTCVIRGCVPKKLMVFASEYRNMPAQARSYGWDIADGRFDWGSFSARLHAELDRLETVYRKLLAGSGVETYDARARLRDAHTVELSTGEVRTARHILIATGGRPALPDMPGADIGIVSDDIFHLPELPKKILIVGGGYIACEFACILNGLGVEVTQYYRGAQILRGFDDEARGLIADEMRAQGVRLHTGTNILEARTATEGPGIAAPVEATQYGMPPTRGGKGPVWVKATNGDTETFDHVFFATGRRPNSADLGLENLGVELGRNGQIVVDAYSQTSVPSIFAIGDVTDRVNLTPVAIREGMAFVETVFRGNP
ncbi:MAG: NADPH-glutathione reductase, partial [Bacteroidetes bacterium]|nr:NADPH-glutathione reductase [Bacteroidota bacterium]